LDRSRGPSWAKCGRGGPRSGLPAAPTGSQLGNQHAKRPPRGPREAPGGSQLGDQYIKWPPRGSQRFAACDSIHSVRPGSPFARDEFECRTGCYFVHFGLRGSQGLPEAPSGSFPGDVSLAPSGSQLGNQYIKWLPRGSQRLPAWESMHTGNPRRPPSRGYQRLPAWESIHKAAPQRLPRGSRCERACPGN
jgi:hypothetical protein